MHNFQSQQNNETTRINGAAKVNSDLNTDGVILESEPLERKYLTEDSTGKSFEDEDENSVRSEDLSRSEAVSEDAFQTPSTSLQNLSNLEPCQSTDLGDCLGDYPTTPTSKDITPEISTTNTTSINSISRSTSQNQDEEVKKDSFVPEKQESPPVLTTANEPHLPDILLFPEVESELKTLSPMVPNVSTGIVELTLSTESNISKDSSSSTNSAGSTTGNAALLPGTYNLKPSKKKMWYHLFTGSYETRCHNFRKYFKDIPTDEKLIVDYSCALQKDILVQGRMFISQNYLAFYANIFGWQTVISLKLKDIVTMTKENTAIVIPNAVLISTRTEKYFFASFVNRDATHLMILKLWQNALLDKTMSAKELFNLIQSSYGEEVEIGSQEDEDVTDDGVPAASLARAPSTSILSGNDGGVNTTKETRVCSRELEFPSGVLALGQPILSTKSVIHDTEKVTCVANEVNGMVHVGPLTDLSDTSDSEEEDLKDSLPTVIPICPNSHEDGKVVVDSIIPCDVDTLFTMLFTSSKFYIEFHTRRKTFDIVPLDWQEKDGQTSREVSFTVTLNQRMGPKHSEITESQILLPVSKAGYFYAIDVESNNSGIPYADAFFVTNHFCLTRISGQESRLVVVCQVRYRKSIWGLTKSFIEKNSWAGIDEFYSSLEKSLKDECTSLAIAVSSPPSPRGKTSTTVRRRPLRKKGPAPGIPTGAAISIPSGNLPTNIPSVGEIQGGFTEPTISVLTDSSWILKIILSILTSLLILNGFLYLKLTNLEAVTTSPLLLSPPITFTKELPQSHQEWLDLLQRQEALHRFELQKWHDLLISALKILRLAETDLESLKIHVDSYAHTRVYEPKVKLKKSVDQFDSPDSANEDSEDDNLVNSTIT